VKLVDSCGWLEVLTATPLGEAYPPAFKRYGELIVPSVCVLEVARRLLDDVDDTAATEAVAIMGQARVAPLNLALALDAARIGQACRLPFPDNAVLALALRYGVELWTHDEHLRDLPGIHFIEAPGL